MLIPGILSSALLACGAADRTVALEDTGPVPAWSLASEPLLTIDTRGEGRPHEGLIGAIRTKEGLALAELGQPNVRFYDGSGVRLAYGAPVAPLARDNRGRPDDARYVLSMGRCRGNGQLASQDFQSGGFTFLSDSGVTRRTVTVPRRYSFAQLIACLADRSLVLLQKVPMTFGDDGTSVAPARLVRVDSMGGAKVLREIGGTQYFHSRKEKVYAEAPLGKVAMAAASDSVLFIGTSDDSLIEVADFGGKTLRRIDTHLRRRSAVVGDLLKAVTMRIYSEPAPSTRENLRRAIVNSPIISAEVLYDAMLVTRGATSGSEHSNLPEPIACAGEYSIAKVTPSRTAIYHRTFS